MCLMGTSWKPGNATTVLGILPLGHTPLLKSLPDQCESVVLWWSAFFLFFQLTHNTVFHPNMIPNFVNMLFSLAGLTWYNRFKPVV